MSDKTIELIEKMYVEFKDRFEKSDSKIEKMNAVFISRFDSLEGRFDNLEGRFDNLESQFDNLEGRFDKVEGRLDNIEVRQKKLEIKIEDDISHKIRGLYDDREVIKGSLATINGKLDELSGIVTNHELRIQAVESGRSKK